MSVLDDIPGVRVAKLLSDIWFGELREDRIIKAIARSVTAAEVIVPKGFVSEFLIIGLELFKCGYLQMIVARPTLD